MFTLHHLNESRSQRIVWLFELLDCDYEIKVYKRDATTNLAPKSLRDIHPIGAAPVLTHNGKSIAETGAICEYVVHQLGNESLLPPHSDDSHVDVQFWSHFSEGSVMPPLVASLVLNKGKEKASPFFIKFVVGKFVDAVMDKYFSKVIQRNLSFIESHLNGRTWLVGDTPTLADVQMSFPLEALYKNGKLSMLPNTKAYVERLHKEKSYIRAMDKMKKAEDAQI